jgi:hypothetical protein
VEYGGLGTDGSCSAFRYFGLAEEIGCDDAELELTSAGYEFITQQFDSAGSEWDWINNLARLDCL